MKTKRSPDDVPGDAVASARAVTEFWYNVGRDLGSLDKYRTAPSHGSPDVYEYKIKCDPGDVQGVLVMVKGWNEGGYVVGFHRGETIVEALSGMARRVTNGTVKWKEDQYAPTK